LGELTVEKIGSLGKIDGKKFDESYLDNKLKILNEQYSYNKTGFSTAGKFNWMGSLEQKQAFFSFYEGPCVILLKIDAIKDAELESWSGLPIYFYNREGITKTRTFYCEGGKQIIQSKTKAIVESNWFCVNDQIGMTIFGGNNKIKISPGIGFNWSRKESYRDKYTMISASPLSEKQYKSGENLVNMAVVIYPNMPYKIVKEFSKQLRTIKEQLPLGWKGLICQAQYRQKLFTLVNFDSDKEIAKVNLCFPEGAPIFEEETLIEGNQAIVDFNLKRFQTFRQTLRFFLEVSNTKKVKAKIINNNEIKIINITNQPLDVTLKFFDKYESYHIKILNEKSDLINQTIVTNETFQNKGVKINLKGKYIIAKVECKDKL
jgi:hypothetical protein